MKHKMKINKRLKINEGVIRKRNFLIQKYLYIVNRIVHLLLLFSVSKYVSNIYTVFLLNNEYGFICLNNYKNIREILCFFCYIILI